jgi:hypothetical protein
MDEEKVRKELTKMVGTNSTLKNLVFELEQVVFKEIQNEIM